MAMVIGATTPNQVPSKIQGSFVRAPKSVTEAIMLHRGTASASVVAFGLIFFSSLFAHHMVVPSLVPRHNVHAHHSEQIVSLK